MTTLVTLLAAAGCRHAAPPRRPGEAEVVVRAGGRDFRVKVEVARTGPERERGLMYRERLEPDHGMLFLFPQPEVLKFWMHNTYIPLDMIFMDAHRRIVYVEENAEPLTDAPRGPSTSTQYVLEVQGGFARREGLEPGSEVRFVGVE
jgi:uncharacterized membrane protein (UPF0127 family)